MLNIENLKCGFGKHEILHGISLTIPKGQITAIVGQSGCGKTTFLKTLNRMVEEEGGYLSGTITLEGTDIKSLPKEKLRRRVGMVFQQPIAFPHFFCPHAAIIIMHIMIHSTHHSFFFMASSLLS